MKGEIKQFIPYYTSDDGHKACFELMEDIKLQNVLEEECDCEGKTLYHCRDYHERIQKCSERRNSGP